MCFYSIFKFCKRSKRGLLKKTEENLNENKSALLNNSNNNNNNYIKIDELVETPSGEAPVLIIDDNKKMSIIEIKTTNDCCSSSSDISGGSSISSSCNSTSSLNINNETSNDKSLSVHDISINNRFNEKTGSFSNGDFEEKKKIFKLIILELSKLIPSIGQLLPNFKPLARPSNQLLNLDFTTRRPKPIFTLDKIHKELEKAKDHFNITPPPPPPSLLSISDKDGKLTITPLDVLT